VTRVVVLAGACLALAVVARAQAPTAKDGVYTKAQAERGKTAYETGCAKCHATTAKGPVTSDAAGPDLGGDEFLTRWSGKTTGALAKLIRETMPNDFSMEVTEPMSYDITAYILQVNKFPDGATALSADTAGAIIAK
jgi:quinoprotein glucose dehydrogenase